MDKKSALKRKYRFHTTDNLRKSLERSKHIKSLQKSKKTKIATLNLADALLEVFFEGVGWFGAHTSKEKNLILGGNATHTDLRKALQDGGYIRVEERPTGNGRKPVLILPGKKLSRYVNIENKIEGRAVATVNQVVETNSAVLDNKKRIERLEEEMAYIMEALKSHIEEFDPPFTEEKREARIRLVKK